MPKTGNRPITAPIRNTTGHARPQPMFQHSLDPKRAFRLVAANAGFLIAKQPLDCRNQWVAASQLRN
jgi:hypothetical protein